MNKLRKLLPAAVIIFFPLLISAQSIIPKPQSFNLKSSRKFFFRDIAAATRIEIDSTLKLPSAEGYIIKITPRVIKIAAHTLQGAEWAKQTLNQMKKKDNNGFLLPDAEITDYPAFPIRGFMLDTGRNFMEVNLLKKYITILSMYKVNVFHWHLTDNPGWRIECKVYPQLNSPEFQIKGRNEGKFYTYKEIRDVIQFSKKLGIMVIPEIDMPGHSAYFPKAFGFKMETAEGIAVLEKCLKEFFDEIPADSTPYFHIGSDEVRISDPKGFVQWAETYVRNSGRIPIVWDPGLPASSGTIRQIWSDNAAVQTAAGNVGKFIDSFMGYLNYFDPVVFTYKLMLHKTINSAQNLGGILCLWNDVNAADKKKISVHNGFLNGLLPFAERFWAGSCNDSLANRSLIPSPESEAGKHIHEFEQRMIAQRDGLLKDEPFYWVASASQPWLLSEPLPAGADSAGVKWNHLWGGSIDLDAYSKSLNVKTEKGMRIYARTSIYSETDTGIDAWIGFEAPARSNRISWGIGNAGEWENKGEVRVNGTLISPPAWKEPGAYNFPFNTWHRPEELLSYTDEQFYWMRTPARIQLKKGWNRIEITIPKNFDGQRWSFSFTPLKYISPGHFKEIKGIKFSVPSK